MLASCEKEVAPHEPGAPDADGCYGVYFPSQEATGSHIYNPTQDPSIDITVARTKSEGAITVPVKYTFSEDGIFVPGEVSFADGQAETTLTIRFDKAVEGTTYDAHLVIEDNAYASIYNSNPIGLDFSVLRVDMKYFLDPKTGEKAVVHWTLGRWGETVDTYIKYYEVNDVRTCFTETIPTSHFYNEPYEAWGFWGTAEKEGEGEWTFIWYPKAEDEEGNQYINLISQPTGWHHSSYDADVWVYDYYGFLKDLRGDDVGSFLDEVEGFNGAYGYYDGNGGFFLYVEYYYMSGIGGWNDATYDVVGISSGFTRVDYSIKAVEAGLTQEGVLPLAVYTGLDVAQVDVVAAAGELTPTQVANTVNAIAAGTAENVISLKDLVAAEYEEEEVLATAAELTLDATGVYTIVVASRDASGAVQESSSITATYVAPGDVEEMAVVLTCGIGSAEKYVGQGANTDSCLEIWAYGSDIVDAKIAAVKFTDLISDKDGALEAVKESDSLSAEDIASINEGGYVGVAQKLLPGTEYYTVVWASNGYSEGYFISEGSAYTTGEPLPIYQNFSVADFVEAGAFENAKAACGTWNYYAVDVYGETGMREYLGKVTVSESTTPTEGPDDYGLYDEYVLVDGLFPNAPVDGPKYGYDLGSCVLEMDVYNGIIYSCSNTTFDGKCSVHIYASGTGKWMDYAQAYFSAFIPVAEGYYAFVDVSQYAGSYNFTGLRVVNEYVWDAFYDMLLVNPEKDDNGLAPASVSKAVFQARERIAKCAGELSGIPFASNKEFARAVIDNYKNGSSVRVSIPEAVEGVCPVKTVKVSASAAVPSVSVKSGKRINDPVSKF